MLDTLSSHIIHIFIAALVFMPFEKLLPRNRAQHIFRVNWGIDTVYALIGGLLSLSGYVLIITLAVICFAPFVPPALRAFVGSQHIILQVICVLLIGDLWYYYAHRLCHRVPFLWRFHAIHHSIEDMDWLAAHRVHPIDQTLTSGAATVIPILLGFSASAFAISAFLVGWHSLLKHSNVNVGFGVLDRVIVSPAFHHWHHANQKEAYDKNFARMFPFIDTFFQTALHKGSQTPEVYGVDDDLPDSFLRQLVSPFRAERKTDQTSSVPAE